MSVASIRIRFRKFSECLRITTKVVCGGLWKILAPEAYGLVAPIRTCPIKLTEATSVKLYHTQMLQPNEFSRKDYSPNFPCLWLREKFQKKTPSVPYKRSDVTTKTNGISFSQIFLPLASRRTPKENTKCPIQAVRCNHRDERDFVSRYRGSITDTSENATAVTIQNYIWASLNSYKLKIFHREKISSERI